MSMRVKLHQLVHAIRRSPAVISEEAYWDQYVRRRRSSPCQGTYVGSEWGNEEDFLSLLRQYADPGKRALEIGCGGGRITATAASLFAHVQAADCSQEMLRECRAAIRAPNVSFHKLDGFTLKEFPDQSVELAVLDLLNQDSGEAFEHLTVGKHRISIEIPQCSLYPVHT